MPLFMDVKVNNLGTYTDKCNYIVDSWLHTWESIYVIIRYSYACMYIDIIVGGRRSGGVGCAKSLQH